MQCVNRILKDNQLSGTLNLSNGLSSSLQLLDLQNNDITELRLGNQNLKFDLRQVPLFMILKIFLLFLYLKVFARTQSSKNRVFFSENLFDVFADWLETKFVLKMEPLNRVTAKRPKSFPHMKHQKIVVQLHLVVTIR